MKVVKNICFPLFLLVLFTTYRVGTTLFVHAHHIDGILVTHSHPNKGEHSHTTAAFTTLDRLSFFHPALPDQFTEVTVVYTLIDENRTNLITGSCSRLVAGNQSLRAPPACKLS